MPAEAILASLVRHLNTLQPQHTQLLKHGSGGSSSSAAGVGLPSLERLSQFLLSRLVGGDAAVPSSAHASEHAEAGVVGNLRDSITMALAHRDAMQLCVVSRALRSRPAHERVGTSYAPFRLSPAAQASLEAQLFALLDAGQLSWSPATATSAVDASLAHPLARIGKSTAGAGAGAGVFASASEAASQAGAAAGVAATASFRLLAMAADAAFSVYVLAASTSLKGKLRITLARFDLVQGARDPEPGSEAATSDDGAIDLATLARFSSGAGRGAAALPAGSRRSVDRHDDAPGPAPILAAVRDVTAVFPVSITGAWASAAPPSQQRLLASMAVVQTAVMILLQARGRSAAAAPAAILTAVSAASLAPFSSTLSLAAGAPATFIDLRDAGAARAIFGANAPLSGTCASAPVAMAPIGAFGRPAVGIALFCAASSSGGQKHGGVVTQAALSVQVTTDDDAPLPLLALTPIGRSQLSPPQLDHHDSSESQAQTGTGRIAQAVIFAGASYGLAPAASTASGKPAPGGGSSGKKGKRGGGAGAAPAAPPPVPRVPGSAPTPGIWVDLPASTGQQQLQAGTSAGAVPQLVPLLDRTALRLVASGNGNDSAFASPVIACAEAAGAALAAVSKAWEPVVIAAGETAAAAASIGAAADASSILLARTSVSGAQAAAGLAASAILPVLAGTPVATAAAGLSSVESKWGKIVVAAASPEARAAPAAAGAGAGAAAVAKLEQPVSLLCAVTHLDGKIALLDGPAFSAPVNLRAVTVCTEPFKPVASNGAAGSAGERLDVGDRLLSEHEGGDGDDADADEVAHACPGPSVAELQTVIAALPATSSELPRLLRLQASVLRRTQKRAAAAAAAADASSSDRKGAAGLGSGSPAADSGRSGAGTAKATASRAGPPFAAVVAALREARLPTVLASAAHGSCSSIAAAVAWAATAAGTSGPLHAGAGTALGASILDISGPDGGKASSNLALDVQMLAKFPSVRLRVIDPSAGACGYADTDSGSDDEVDLEGSGGIRCGRYYIEYELGEGRLNSTQLGFADARFGAHCEGSSGVGDDAHSWALDPVRSKKWHVHGLEHPIVGGKGSVLCIAVDLDNKAMWGCMNGQWSGPAGDVAFSSVNFTGGLFPAFSAGEGTVIKLRLGDAAHPFKYGPPPGFAGIWECFAAEHWSSGSKPALQGVFIPPSVGSAASGGAGGSTSAATAPERRPGADAPAGAAMASGSLASLSPSGGPRPLAMDVACELLMRSRLTPTPSLAVPLTASAALLGDQEKALNWTRAMISAPGSTAPSSGPVRVSHVNRVCQLIAGRADFSEHENGLMVVFGERCSSVCLQTPLLTRGRWYFELHIYDGRDPGYGVGIMNENVQLRANDSDSLGMLPGSWAANLYQSPAQAVVGGVRSITGLPRCYDGTNVGVAIDLEAGAMFCSNNGNWTTLPIAHADEGPASRSAGGLDISKGVQIVLHGTSSVKMHLRTGAAGSHGFHLTPPPGYRPLWHALPEVALVGRKPADVAPHDVLPGRADLDLRRILGAQPLPPGVTPQSIVRGPNHGVLLSAEGAAFSFASPAIGEAAPALGWHGMQAADFRGPRAFEHEGRAYRILIDTQAAAAGPGVASSTSNSRVVQAAVGRAHTLLLTDNGDVLGCGLNGRGQLANAGVSNGDVLAATRINFIAAEPTESDEKAGKGATGSRGGSKAAPLRVWQPRIVSIAAAQDFSAAVDEDGYAWVWGAVPRMADLITLADMGTDGVVPGALHKPLRLGKLCNPRGP